MRAVRAFVRRLWQAGRTRRDGEAIDAAAVSAPDSRLFQRIRNTE
jgi:hypothetical protein